MIDTSSPVWRGIAEKAAARIEELRTQLERTESDEITRRLRGEIKAWRDVLSMGETDRAPVRRSFESSVPN